MSRVEQVYGKVWLANITGVLAMCQELRDNGQYQGYSAKDIGILTVCEDQLHDACRREFGVGLEIMPAEILYIKAGLNDGPPDHSAPYGPPNATFRYAQAVAAIDFMCRIKKMVVVHCWSGVSRSSFVVATYMWWKEKGDFDIVFEGLKAVYPHANPHPKHRLELEKVLPLIKEYLERG